MANDKTKEGAEKAFATSVESSVKEALSYGRLDEAQAEKMLMEYAGKDEEEAASKVSYWSFLDAHPEYEQYNLSESNVGDYLEFAEPAEIPMDVFVQYRDGTKDIETIRDEWGDVVLSEQDQVIDAIDLLPLTKQQKDALFLAYGYKESSLWKVTWYELNKGGSGCRIPEPLFVMLITEKRRYRDLLGISKKLRKRWLK